VVEIEVGVDAEPALHGVAGALADGCFEAAVEAFVGSGGDGWGQFTVGDGGGFPTGGDASSERLGRWTEEIGELLAEAGSGFREQNAVLRAFGAGYAGLDGAEVEREGLGVLGFRAAGGVEEALCLVVGR
jgi:hypothetical protein